MNWYTFMWLDAIEKAHKTPSFRGEKDKNFILLWGFAFAQSANILSLNIVFFLFKIEFTTYSFAQSYVLNFLYLIIIPMLFFGINYFAFFYKKKYTKLISLKKESRGGKLFTYYFFISLGFFVGLMILL